MEIPKGKIQVEVEITRRDNRMCSHCCVEATPDGPFLPFSELELIAGQIGHEIRKGEALANRVVLLGEILAYQDKGHGLGDVIDIFHDQGIGVSGVTRGWTKKECVLRDPPYMNYLEFKERMGHPLHPTVTVSFDTYAFCGNQRLSKEMLINTIQGFKELQPLTHLYMVVAPQTIRSSSLILERVLKREGYAFATSEPNVPQPREGSIAEVMDEIMSQAEPPEQVVVIPYLDGLEHTVIVHYVPLQHAGRATQLEEPVYWDGRFRDCQVLSGESRIVVRADGGVVHCCSEEFTHIPGTHSFRETGHIIPDYDKTVHLPPETDFRTVGGWEGWDFPRYFFALQRMEAAYREQAREMNICTYCAEHLQQYISQDS